MVSFDFVHSFRTSAVLFIAHFFIPLFLLVFLEWFHTLVAVLVITLSPFFLFSRAVRGNVVTYCFGGAEWCWLRMLLESFSKCRAFFSCQLVRC